MKSKKEITKKLIKVLHSESQKFSEDTFFIESENMLSSLKSLGLIQKATYDYPMADTLGKGVYASINQALELKGNL
jgi:hypothetical protein